MQFNRRKIPLGCIPRFPHANVHINIFQKLMLLHMFLKFNNSLSRRHFLLTPAVKLIFIRMAKFLKNALCDLEMIVKQNI